MLWALVPIKQLKQSKQRLKRVLAPGEREGLTLAMARDVLRALQGVSTLEGIVLVSRCPSASVLSREFGTALFAESSGADLSAAVTEASEYVAARYHARGTMIIPGDVPLATTADFEALLVNHEQVTLVSDRGGEGTNAMLCSPANAVSYHFGHGSWTKHLESSHAAGLTPRVVRNARLAHDIDEPADLQRILAAMPPSCTREYLRHINLAARLNQRHPSETLALS